MNDNSATADASVELSQEKTYIALSWNIEGLARNIHNLQHFIYKHKPDLVFLSEPQVFACDVDSLMSFLKKDYEYNLNSSDRYDLSLPLVKSKAVGGTMIL